jgi:hypothetical protein
MLSVRKRLRKHLAFRAIHLTRDAIRTVYRPLDSRKGSKDAKIDE